MVTREIADNIRKIVGPVNVVQTYLCKVTEISGKTCRVIRVIDDKVIPRVRLNATIRTTPKEELLIIPKIDSLVLVTDLEGGDYFISQYSQIDKINLDFETEIAINGGNNGKIVINGGENCGLVMIKELHTKLKNLEKAFNDHVHTNASFDGTISGNPAKGTLTVPKTAGNSEEFQNGYSGYENEKIKH